MDAQDIVVRLNESWSAAHSTNRTPIPPKLVTDAVDEIERLRKIVAEYVPVKEYGKIRLLAAIKKEVVLSALEFNSGNVHKTCRDLHVGKSTMYRWLREWGVQT